MKKVTKPASGYTSRFCGVCVRLTAAGLDFAVAVGADCDFTLCPVGDFGLCDGCCVGLTVNCGFVIQAFLRLVNLQNYHLQN